jgi:hypothetical protein
MPKKLHQVIATEGQTAGGYTKIVAETKHVFKGADHLNGISKVYTPKEEGGQPMPSEKKEVVTTVGRRLKWNEAFAVKLFDHELTRDQTNCIAKSDLNCGSIAIKDAPATFLLVFEKRLMVLREAYDAIPTLDMSFQWEPQNEGSDIMKTGPIVTNRTEKTIVPLLMAPATDKHPAQIEKLPKDILVGTWETYQFSGRITPELKAELLLRIDRLIEAVRDARMQANNAEVIDGKIGDQVFKYLHEGL